MEYAIFGLIIVGIISIGITMMSDDKKGQTVKKDTERDIEFTPEMEKAREEIQALIDENDIKITKRNDELEKKINEINAANELAKTKPVDFDSFYKVDNAFIDIGGGSSVPIFHIQKIYIEDIGRDAKFWRSWISMPRISFYKEKSPNHIDILCLDGVEEVFGKYEVGRGLGGRYGYGDTAEEITKDMSRPLLGKCLDTNYAIIAIEMASGEKFKFYCLPAEVKRLEENIVKDWKDAVNNLGIMQACSPEDKAL